MKKLIFSVFTFFSVLGFSQNTNIEKTLHEINNSFTNMEVKILRWPKHIEPNLEKLKDTAFIAFPKNETKGKLPLLISLHGGGGRTWSIEQQLKRSAKVKGLALAELAGKNLILLEPNSYAKWNPKSLNIILDYILKTYPQIDENRIYVIGHSMGGLGTWDWIQVSPERFAAVAPSGFRGISENADFNKLVNLPIFGMVGGEDGKNVAAVKKMTMLLKDTGNKNVRYLAFPGANHAQGNKGVFSNVDCVNWMLSFTLK